jgi:hypothetical protein
VKDLVDAVLGHFGKRVVWIVGEPFGKHRSVFLASDEITYLDFELTTAISVSFSPDPQI